ncbi:MAG: hypothetical protein E3K32_04215 [wastewater metagenome]|nr:hypothetical protein [Candidatus Loosdrechtia aerotolerans]
MGIVSSAVIAVSVLLLGSNYVYAEKEAKRKLGKVAVEPGKKTVTGRCPKCKLERERPIKGKAYQPVQWKMKCPECGTEMNETLVIYCDECGAEFLECPVCRGQHMREAEEEGFE